MCTTNTCNIHMYITDTHNQFSLLHEILKSIKRNYERQCHVSSCSWCDAMQVKSDIIMHYREEILKFQSVTHIMLCSRNCVKPLTNINTFNPPNNQRRKVILALPYRFRHRATGKLCNPFPSRYQYRHSVPEHCFLNSYPQVSRTSNAI